MTSTVRGHSSYHAIVYTYTDDAQRIDLAHRYKLANAPNLWFGVEVLEWPADMGRYQDRTAASLDLQASCRALQGISADRGR